MMKDNGLLKRNSNIEFLRIILILMVLTMHFINSEMGGGANYNFYVSNNKILLQLLNSLSVCAVNCFMIISGYFLAYNKKVKLWKVLELLLIVIFYRLIDYFILCTIGATDFQTLS